VYNATCTLYAHGRDFDDDTGYPTEEDEPEILLQDAPCLFSPASGARATVNGSGMKEYSKTLPQLLLEADEDFDVRVGDQADVLLHGEDTAKRYGIERAEKVVGIGGAEWFLELERIDVPANG
jgi:hypothetical protein